MNCINKLKEWTVYDAKDGELHNLSHEEFRNFLLDRPVKLTGRFIYINGIKTWIDGLLNSEWLSKEGK